MKSFENYIPEIIYEDYIIIVVNKPAGLATQNTQNPKKENLYGLLQKFLNKREGKEIYLALHHRLDAATSGLVMFCKNRNYNKYITDLFRDKNITKIYHAIVDTSGKESIEDEWEVVNHLKTYSIKHFKKAKSANKGDLAITSFKKIKEKNNFALIECYPQTGRLHQIRVHLAEDGLPVVGDFHYHPKKQQGELMLHATELKFIHPKTKEDLHLKSEIPSYFMELLS